MTLALVILGPPGGGKHELAHALSQRLEVPLVDVGEIMSTMGNGRREGALDFDNPEQALRDEVRDRIETAAISHGTVVVEGFPSTMAQLYVLESMLGLRTSYIVSSCPLHVCVRRIAERKRRTDHPDSVALRMRTWFGETQPMLDRLPKLVLDEPVLGTEGMVARVLKTHERKLNGARR